MTSTSRVASGGVTSGSKAKLAWSTSGVWRQIADAGLSGEGWRAGDVSDRGGGPAWYSSATAITVTAMSKPSNSVPTIAIELVTNAAARLNSSDMDLHRTALIPTDLVTNWTTTTTVNWSVVESFSTTGGASEAPLLRHSHLLYTVLTCFILGAIILAAIVGNAFVIAAIVLERNLHSVANYLIASLAVADLLVAVLVMPLAAVNEISSRWFFGSAACDAFVSFDVLCCTESILHLVAISVDRYWAVTRVDYIHNRPVSRIVAMIALSWAISTVISIPPLFGWKSPDDDPDITGVCLISQVKGISRFKHYRSGLQAK